MKNQTKKLSDKQQQALIQLKKLGLSETQIKALITKAAKGLQQASL